MPVENDPKALPSESSRDRQALIRSLARSAAFSACALFALLYAVALLGAWRTGKFGPAATLFLEFDTLLMITSLAIGMAVMGSLFIFGAAFLLSKRTAASDSKPSEDA